MSSRDKDRELSWYKRVALELLWAISWLIGRSPRWFQYGMLRPLFTFLLRMARYRRKVIIENLTRSFPEKNDKQIKAIMRDFYYTLGEVVVSTMALASAKPERDGDLLEWVAYREHIEHNRGRDWVAMASHFGCWEYYPLWCWLDTECHFMSVYHPLKSDIFEHFYRRMRKFAPNITTVAMADTVRHYIKRRSPEYTTVLGLISDQSPRLMADSKWLDFLGQKTTFIEGGERLALKFSIPAYFVYAERVAPGRYRARFIELYDGKEPLKEGDIVRRYAETLEKMVREHPELWMWSHKRWKHTPEKQRKKFGRSTLDVEGGQ